MTDSSEVYVKVASRVGENSPLQNPFNSLLDQDVDDSSDAYLLGTREHPGLSIVSIPLNSKNYLSWSNNIITSLKANKKERFIFEVLPIPKFGHPD